MRLITCVSVSSTLKTYQQLQPEICRNQSPPFIILALTPVTNLFLEAVSGLKTTFAIESKFGLLTDAATLKYNGCVGSLQRNETDFIPWLAMLPLNAANISHPVAFPNLES